MTSSLTTFFFVLIEGRMIILSCKYPHRQPFVFVLLEGKRVILLCNEMWNYRDTLFDNCCFLSYLRVEWLFYRAKKYKKNQNESWPARTNPTKKPNRLKNTITIHSETLTIYSKKLTSFSICYSYNYNYSSFYLGQ